MSASEYPDTHAWRWPLPAGMTAAERRAFDIYLVRHCGRLRASYPLPAEVPGLGDALAEGICGADCFRQAAAFAHAVRDLELLRDVLTEAGLKIVIVETAGPGAPDGDPALRSAV